MKYFLIVLFLISCGEDESKIVEVQLPPPIPPITKYEPLPPPVPAPQPTPEPDTAPPQITYDQCLNDAKRQYPWIRFQYGNVPNAMTQFFGYRNVVITLSYNLRREVDAEQFCLIINHEVGHAVNNNGDELAADWASVYYMRQMLQRRRYINTNQRMNRVVMKQYRWLRNKPQSPNHPTPRKRLRAMKKSVNRQKLNRSDYL